MVLAGILALPITVPAAANGAAEVAKEGSVSLDRSELRQLINQVSLEYGVDPKLVDALVRVESSYDPRAVSRKGAMGLMQLMPDTADRLEVEDPFDPEENVRGGVKEFSRLVDRYAGNLQLALAAYNAGEGAVARYRGVPPYNETRNYVSRILTLYTGRPYRLAGTYRAKPVRMVRDRNGNTVITNVSSTSTTVTASIRASTLGGDGPLRGGFGSTK
ncbi:MAG: lytic transglycosylase domain-containing protein [Acidobacteria bacterium]|nr:lytic transglycosylase domain-containing protein [Candidatus Sulfomarinibacter sp. MAG AM1]